jgi:hypothetical protein
MAANRISGIEAFTLPGNALAMPGAHYCRNSSLWFSAAGS